MLDTTKMNQCFISVSAFTQYMRMAESCGLDCRSYLEYAGIDQNIINDNCNRIPSDLLETFLQKLIHDCQNPHFGLHTSRFIQQDSYSVLGYIAFNSSNLKEYWQHVPIYEKIVGDMGTSQLKVFEDQSLFAWQCNLINPLVRRHVTENVIASWYAYAKLVFHFDEHPNRIFFIHEAPKNSAQRNHYQDFFQCEVLFNQSCNGIWVDNRIVNLPIPQANTELLATLLEHASQVLLKIDKSNSVTDKVKNYLRLTINDSIPSRESVANQMCMSSRHLQRKLKDEGTGYKEVLQELRTELAIHYLTTSDMSMDIIATKLGFNETRSFYRSFKQWTGKTAGEYRKL